MLNCHNNLLVLVGARWFTRLSRLPLNSLLPARLVHREFLVLYRKHSLTDETLSFELLLL